MSRATIRRIALAVAFLAPGPLAAQGPAAVPAAVPPTTAANTLEAYPPRIVLTGPRDEQRIGVLAGYADRRTWDVSSAAGITSSNPKVVVIDAGNVARPVGDGPATLTVALGAEKRSVAVTVVKSAEDEPVSFAREIVPILTRGGCNQGACHGAQHGRGGFRLSLLGFDPVFDYAQVVQSAEGRRVVLADPAQSILLQKPALLMEHGGGERFKAGSPAYERMKRWLEDGAPPPGAKDAEVAAIEVWPARRIMVPGERQQLLVTARWTDGKTEDVTATAQFNTLNEGIATVAPDGRVTAVGRGETHVMVRFGGQATVARITLPYAPPGPHAAWPRHNFIDDKLQAKWQDLGLSPSPLCSDEAFFRRIHLDAIGTLPTPAAIKAFLADRAPDKRQKAIDRVLERPEFVDYWALKWGDLLRINRDALNDRGMWSFHNWVRASLRDRKPLDEIVRDIITAEGSTFTEGPANYFMVSRSPGDWAETTAQLFLGVRIGCAKCHHHPFERWSQDDYAGMSAFFVRLGTKPSQEFGLFGAEQVVYLKPGGEQAHPRKGGLVKPHPLGGPTMDDPIDRRVKLAEWITRSDNPFFARNIVNRVWGYYMGRGLVEPLDDMRATNPASNPELLDALAADFVAHRFDLRYLMRTIMSARGYQLSAESAPANQADVQNIHFTRYTVRRLSAEPLADAIDFATGTVEKYPGLPLGTRAIQLPDSGVKSFFLDTFGRPARQITCECERTTQPNIAQALHLLHGEFLGKKIGDPKGRLDRLLKAKAAMPDIIEELYLVTLSRPPRTEEIDRARHWITQAPTPREGLQDLLWALLNAREFLFNH